MRRVLGASGNNSLERNNSLGPSSSCSPRVPSRPISQRESHHRLFQGARGAERRARRALLSAANSDSNVSDEFTRNEVQLRRIESLNQPKTLVRVKYQLHYRVHSRQILCIGGSHIPLGWSFLSIAKVPMTWNAGDIWTCEVELAAGQRVEHKYTILEQQDWTKLENDDTQGLVPAEITYRAGNGPGKPPDVNQIMKQMAIVAWQPGPNRILQVPTEAELMDLKPGDSIERTPPRPNNERLPYGQDPFEGTREWLTMDDEGRPLLERFDVWGWVPSAGARPADNLKGYNINFG